MSKKNGIDKGYVDMQFRVAGEMKKHLLELEEKTGQTRAAIGRDALYYYLLKEKHGMK